MRNRLAKAPRQNLAGEQMSLLFTGSYANPNQPLWVPFGGGGGGGSNLVVDTIAVNQGGNITMGSSANTGTFMIWNKDISGTTAAVLQTLDDQNNNPFLTLYNEANNYDALFLGNVFAHGTVNTSSANNQIVLGNLSGELGLASRDYNTGVVTPYLDVCGNNLADLKNIQSINGASPGGAVSFYDYVDYLPLGLLVPVVPLTAQLNTITFTPLSSGFANVTATARVDSTTGGDTDICTFSVNGTPIAEIEMSSYYAVGGISQNLTNIYRFPILAGTPYTVDFTASSGFARTVVVASKMNIVLTA